MRKMARLLFVAKTFRNDFQGGLCIEHGSGSGEASLGLDPSTKILGTRI